MHKTLLLIPTLLTTTVSAQEATEVKPVELADGRLQIGELVIDPSKRSITFPATVNMTDNTVEYLLVTPAGKKHESVFSTTIDARHLHIAALLLLGKPLAEAPAPTLTASISWRTNGPSAHLSLSGCLEVRNTETGQRNATIQLPETWTYNGSRMHGPTLQAHANGNFIAIIEDPDALINSTFPTRDNDDLHFPATLKLPKIGTPVTVTLLFQNTPAKVQPPHQQP